MSLSWKALPTIGLLALVFVANAGGRRATTCPAAGALLPDLVQEVPSDLGVVSVRLRSRRAFFLSFASAMSNVGRGPLVVVGWRAPGGTEMRADQIVRRSDGSSCAYRGVGKLRFNGDRAHDHWHLVGFDQYLLIRPGARTIVTRDHKVGFCLGDRAPLEPRAPRAVNHPVWTSDCGVGKPRARTVAEGISIGWADVYPAFIEGQFLDITRAGAGRYVLVNRVSPSRSIHETDYRNDAASVLIDLRWPRGRNRPPAIRVVSDCPGKPSC